MNKISNIIVSAAITIFMGSCCNPNANGLDSNLAFSEYLRTSPVSQANYGIDFTARANTIRQINQRYPGSYVSNHLSRVEDWCRKTPSVQARASAAARAARAEATRGQDGLMDVGQEIGKATSDSPRDTLGNEFDGFGGRFFTWALTETYANGQASSANNAIIEPHMNEYRKFISDEAFLSNEHCFQISEHLQRQLSELD